MLNIKLMIKNKKNMKQNERHNKIYLFLLLFLTNLLILNIIITNFKVNVIQIINTKNKRFNLLYNKFKLYQYKVIKNINLSTNWNEIVNTSKLNYIFKTSIFMKLFKKNNFLKLNIDKSDEEYIHGYYGGELEPEWYWAKNISIVYTWVDGSDINFLDQKAKYDHGYKTNDNRYRSMDELRYSLRSLKKYMPWHEGMIYIVTNNQIPSWINVTHPQIKIIDHQQIIPEHIRPTYNSNTIELFLDKIPGLTEQFIYFNDDVFINNFIHPAFFFTSINYYPKVYKNYNLLNVSESEIDDYIKHNTNMFKTTNYNTLKYIQEYFDQNFQYHTLCHTPFPLYRDIFEPYRQLFMKEWQRQSAYRFRSHYNFQVIYLYQVFLQYATQNKRFPLELGGNGKAKYFKGKSLPLNRTVRDYSVKIYSGDISKKYVIYGKVIDDTDYNLSKFSSIKNNKEILIYNINDEYTEDYVSLQLLAFLMEQYPEPSDFENFKYKNLENEVQVQLNFINSIHKYNQKENSELNTKSKNNRNKQINYKNKISILKEYINKKKKLTKSNLSLSLREKEEINLLLKYNGNELENEYLWAKNTSIVYYFENSGDIYSKQINALQMKYSILSLKKYLPWHSGNIFVITEIPIDNELSWLKYFLKQSKIKIYSQNDIFPKNIYQQNSSSINKMNSEKIKIFNKNIVEMYLDHLPNISERFIYIQSNYFFLNYVHPRFFFGYDGSPKYYFKKPLSKKEEEKIKLIDPSFYMTYLLIRKYFGKYYIEAMRYLINAPFTCYRDLFDPVRKLYQKEIEKYINKTKYYMNPKDNSINKKNICYIYENNLKFDKYLNNDKSIHFCYEDSYNILFLYLLANYNIYGTDHPHYPDFVVGFGKIKDPNIKLPKLNNNRTLSYYGFDISSSLISKSTLLTISEYSNDASQNTFFKINLQNTKKLFFKLKISEKLSKKSIKLLDNLLNELYN